MILNPLILEHRSTAASVPHSPVSRRSITFLTPERHAPAMPPAVFEKLVAGLLNKHLGPYVEGLDPKQLSLGAWSGDINLKSLRLKAEMLAEMDLPVSIVHGYVGALRLKIPWKGLFPKPSKPVEAFIEDLYLLLEPQLDHPYDAAKTAKLAAAAKTKRLEAWEEEQKAKEASAEEKHSNASFTAKLITSIVNNLQVGLLLLFVVAIILLLWLLWPWL